MSAEHHDKWDIVVAGVGGQGVLTAAHVVALAGLRDGLWVKHSEVHGLSQRGGAVHAGVRLGREPVASELISAGSADVLVALEPVEGLRHTATLSPSGMAVVNTAMVADLPTYPAADAVLAAVQALPRVITLDATALASAAGNRRALGIVMVGAAAPHLGVSLEALRGALQEVLAPRGPAAVAVNLAAFEAGLAV